MKPRLLPTQPKTIAIEHLGAWRDLLGKHARGRECRAWLYGPETLWFYLVPEGLEAEINAYIEWLDGIQLGPQVYPLYGRDLLEAISGSKSARKYIKYLQQRGAQIRFFDAKQKHYDFARRQLGIRSWSREATSCLPVARRFTNKIETRRLMEQSGLSRCLLPWRAVSYGQLSHEEAADRIVEAMAEINKEIDSRGLRSIVDSLLLKHPTLASGAGIQKVQTRQDVVSFLEEYDAYRCPELLIEAGVSHHRSVSKQTFIGRDHDTNHGESIQSINTTDGSFAYVGNVMSSRNDLIEPAVLSQMAWISQGVNRALRAQKVRGYSVLDFLVDSHQRVWFLEDNLRVTATVYLKGFLNQIAPRFSNGCVGVIRNIDIPQHGAQSLFDIFWRLGELRHNGQEGVFPCMFEALPSLCLVSTASTHAVAEESLRQAIERLTRSEQQGGEEALVKQEEIVLMH